MADTNRGILRRLARRVWLRGFLAALLLVLVRAFSVFVHTIAQTGGKAPMRCAVTRGVVLADWPSNGGWAGWGKVQLRLGVLMNGDGTNAWGVWMQSHFRKPSAQWDAELHPGHVKVPLLYVAAVAAMPAGVGVWLRRRRVRIGHCVHCGYDLRGSGGGTCPECGEATAEA